MANSTILRSTFSLLLLFTVVVITAVGGKNEQGLLHNNSTTPKNTNSSFIVTSRRENGTENLSTKVRVTGVKDESIDNDEDEEDEEEDGEEEEDEEEEEEEDEAEDGDGEMDEAGSEVDEYEDELRGIAESHEAMSRDERRNGISSTTSFESLVNENQSLVDRHSGMKNYDSLEKSDEMMSDESVVSNEAIPRDDEEVAELLRYKQKAESSLLEKKNLDDISQLSSKVKRVPTVKKELSTQKEIFTTNETQLSLPKTVVSHPEIVNRLDDDIKPETRFEISPNSRDNVYELMRDDTILDEEYPDVETSGDLLRKFDKRQPLEPNLLRSYFLDGYTSEDAQRRKLQELGIEEGELAESLMELLTRLAEDPRLWERVHRILADLERSVPFSREALLDSRKRAQSSHSLIEMPMSFPESDLSDTISTTKKPKKKKKKKKKKKVRHHTTNNATSTDNRGRLTNSLKSMPVTSSPEVKFLTTPATNWPATTQAQWRLVAERLFNAPWSEDQNHESSVSTTKVRAIKDRLASIDEKQRANLKTLNDERQALMLQSAREYSQPRRLHYGKVNTHEKSSANDDSRKNYDSEQGTGAIDYNLSGSGSYQQRPVSVDRYDRYAHYGRQRMQDYDLIPEQQENDYDIYRVPETIGNHRPFAKTQQFRPLGREYTSTKTWPDSRYGYVRPWKNKNRSNFENIGSGSDWPWRSTSNDNKVWLSRYREPWTRDRTYWQRLSNMNDEMDEIENEEVNRSNILPLNRQGQQPQQPEDSWRRRYDDSRRWQVNRNVNRPEWQVHERPKTYGREIVHIGFDKSKNLSELSNKETVPKSSVIDKPVLPKITMKTWNSLTSDPATWPFKLNGAKPWPKDKDGKSYNPNAELVRKLGLDKQDRLLSSNKDTNSMNKEILPHDSSEYKTPENIGIEANDRSKMRTIVNSAKGSIDWPEKLSAVKEWRSKPGKENERLPQRDDARQIWQTGLDSDRKIWSGQSPISPKISSVGAWVMPADQSTWRPYDVKHKVYGQVSEVERGGSRWNEGTNSEETDRRPWPTKNDAVSGGWPSKNNNNDWNVVGSVFGSDKSASNGHSSTWPSKWRQFAYHKVTVPPITKPGSLNVIDGSNRPKNSYIAVSAVSSPKYSNNEWRKNEIEESQLDRSSGGNHDGNFDQDDPTSQLRKSSEITNDRWNKQAIVNHRTKENHASRDENDPLEHQLEELRQVPYWSHGQLQKRGKASDNSSIIVETVQTSPKNVKSSSKENINLKNDGKPSTVIKNQTQEKKEVTK